MRKPLLVAGFVVSFALGFGVHRVATAQAYVADTSASPFVSLTPDALTRFWSQQAAARGVTTDAQWNTAMQTLFSTSTSTGVDPTALAFLRSFFIQFVHLGVP